MRVAIRRRRLTVPALDDPRSPLVHQVFRLDRAGQLFGLPPLDGQLADRRAALLGEIDDLERPQRDHIRELERQIASADLDAQPDLFTRQNWAISSLLAPYRTQIAFRLRHYPHPSPGAANRPRASKSFRAAQNDLDLPYEAVADLAMHYTRRLQDELAPAYARDRASNGPPEPVWEGLLGLAYAVQLEFAADAEQLREGDR